MSLPITYDPNAKTIGIEDAAPLADYPDLKSNVDQLNALIKDYISAGCDVPPLPNQQNFSKNISLMVKKMHTSATGLMKQHKFKEAQKQFGIALGLALARPRFESFHGTMSEVIVCLMGRCDASMMAEDFGDAFLDAEILAQLAANVPDNHLRKGICELKLGRACDAKTDFERGLCFSPQHEKLKEHLKLAERVLAMENGDE